MNIFNMDWYLSGLSTDLKRDFDSKVGLLLHCKIVHVIHGMSVSSIKDSAFDFLYV